MPAFTVSSEVSDALRDGRPIVALESTIISHGLPRPRNHEAALEFESMLRDRGVTPALTTVIGVTASVGRSADSSNVASAP